MSDDDDERQSNSNSIIQSSDVDNRRRLSEIKSELQGLMRRKKKYDEEKLKQDAEFLQSEINDLRNSISDINKEINNQTQTKKKLHVQMTNLRSRARLRYTNLTNALRDKRRYEGELKKENKNEEYRELARREIHSIDTAIPILKKEEEYKTHLKEAEDAQQAATLKRKKLEENLNKNLRKQTDIKQLLSDNAEILPQIESTIENLRSEREQLLSLSSTNNKKSRRRLLSNQQRLTDSPTITDSQTPIRSFVSLEEDCLEYEKHQHEDQLNKVSTLINYYHEKLNEHGLPHEPICSSTPSTELISPLYHPITPYEEQTILSSYMEEQNNPDYILTTKTTTNELTPPPPTAAIAMKLPRNFAPLNLNLTTTNEIIHSPFIGRNEIEYKKEFSSDILDKYGGQQKKSNQQHLVSGKKHKKNKKTFSITHNPQMIALYNNVRSSTGSSDTLPSMPMYEYDLYQTIQSLEFLKQSLESYLSELSIRSSKISIDDEQQNDDEDIRDSALDSVSETSSLIEPTKQILQSRLSTSSDEKKTLASSPPPPPPLLPLSLPLLPPSSSYDSKKDYQCTLTTVDELNSHFQPLSINNPQMDRQVSDEGYRSVQNEQQQQQQQGSGTISNHNSPLLTRSKSHDCTDKVGKWLSNTTPSPSSLPRSITYHSDFQPTDIDDDDERNLISAAAILVSND